MGEMIRSSAALAYLGDARLELFVRETLVLSGVTDPGKLNLMSREFVTSEAQSAAVERVLPLLTEKELEIYKRGRNCHTSSHPKHGSVVQYRRATGFEALMGYLHLNGMEERAKEIFELAYAETIGKIANI